MTKAVMVLANAVVRSAAWASADISREGTAAPRLASVGTNGAVSSGWRSAPTPGQRAAATAPVEPEAAGEQLLQHHVHDGAGSLPESRLSQVQIRGGEPARRPTGRVMVGFAVLAPAAIVFVARFLPETKGLSVERVVGQFERRGRVTNEAAPHFKQPAR